MLDQAAQVAAEAGNRIPQFIETGVIALLIKAIVDIGREILRWRQERAKAKAIEAQADIEEAKTYGMAILKSKNGNPERSTLVAFCPQHVDVCKAQAAQENELNHINETLREIKGHVEVIRGAVGK